MSTHLTEKGYNEVATALAAVTPFAEQFRAMGAAHAYGAYCNYARPDTPTLVACHRLADQVEDADLRGDLDVAINDTFNEAEMTGFVAGWAAAAALLGGAK